MKSLYEAELLNAEKIADSLRVFNDKPAPAPQPAPQPVKQVA